MNLRLATILLAALLLPVVASAKSYHAERYDVALDLQADGSLTVTETVVFNFTDGSFTRVFRELPTRRTDGLEILSVTLDGRALPPGQEPGQAQVDYGRTVEVVWHLLPTEGETHTFTLEYRARGVAERAAGADRFAWQALPTDRDYRIAEGTVTLAWPEGTELRGGVTVTGADVQVRTEPGRAVVTFERRSKNHALEIQAEFPSGTVAPQPPNWQQRRELAARVFPLWLAGGAALAAAGILAALGYRRRHQLETPSDLPPESVTAPPADLPPTLAAGLLPSRSDVSRRAFQAGLLSLAERGVIRIVPQPGKVRPRRQGDFLIERGAPDAALSACDEGLLALLFHRRKGPVDRVALSDLDTRYTMDSKRFTAPFRRELVQAGLYDPDRLRARLGLMTAGFIALAAGVIALFMMGIWGVFDELWPVIFLPFGLVAAGVGALIVGDSLSPLTLCGWESSRRWAAFRGYLKQVMRGRETPPPDDRAVDWFTHAAALGLARPWAQYLKRRGPGEAPAWFRAAFADGGGAEFVVMAGAFAATGGGHGGGGSGAAGGGASGAS